MSSIVSIDTRGYDISMGPGFLRVEGGGGIAGNVYINGNVGIGTNAPSSTLDVSGSIAARGLITANGGLTAGGSTSISVPNNGASSYYCGTNGSGANIRMYGNGTDAYIDYYGQFNFRSVNNTGATVLSTPFTISSAGLATFNNGITVTGTLSVNGDVAQTSGGLYSYMTLSRNGGGTNSSFINWYTANGTRLGFMGNGQISGNVGTGDMQLYFENGTTGLVITGDTEKKLTVKGPIGFSYITVPTFTSSQIGYTYSNAITGNILNSGGTISTISTPPKGVWNIGFFIGINAGAAAGYYQLAGGTASGGSDIFPLYFQQYNGGYQSSSLSVPFTFTFTTPASFYLWASSSATYAIYNGRFYATRIA